MSEPQPNPTADVIQEIIGMTNNLKAINTLLDIVNITSVSGSKVQEVAQGLFFLQGMKTGTEARIKELEAQLPKPPPAESVTVSPAVEVAKGEPVLSQ